MTRNIALDPWDLLEALPVPLPDTVPGPLPEREGTLLAVVPVPGTDTALAIVGYAVPTSGAELPAASAQLLAAVARSVSASSPLTSVQPSPEPDSGLVLNRPQRRVWADGRELALTFQEFELLAFLTANPGQVFSRSELLREVWHQPGDAQRRDVRSGDLQGGRTVDVHVSRLRRKLGRPYGRCLITEFRVGYQFRPPAPALGSASESPHAAAPPPIPAASTDSIVVATL